MLALVLHFSNLEFRAHESESRQVASVSFDASHTEASFVSNESQLNLCASELRVPVAKLHTTLCTRTLGGGPVEKYTLPRSCEGAQVVCNSICMQLYALLFRSCVDHINEQMAAFSAAQHSRIGLLDIFGFEVFETNGLAQLCINLTNEMLHNLFIDHVIAQEQKTYLAEGVPWEKMEVSTRLSSPMPYPAPLSPRKMRTSHLPP